MRPFGSRFTFIGLGSTVAMLFVFAKPAQATAVASLSGERRPVGPIKLANELPTLSFAIVGGHPPPIAEMWAHIRPRSSRNLARGRAMKPASP